MSIRPHYAAKRTSCAKLSFAFVKMGGWRSPRG